jgi:protein ImuB
VISLWLPRFAIDRVSRATPDLRAKPAAQVQERGARLGLYAVNDVAGHAGLAPGMALADARAILPSLTVLPATPRDDAKALARLAGWCGRYSPWTAASEAQGEIPTGEEPPISLEGAGGGGIWLDVTGCAHLFGGEETMLTDMIDRLTRSGFMVRAAMADTPGCAWAMARFADDQAPGIVVPPGEAEAALTGLPVAALRLSAATVTGLHGLGVRRVADLLALPAAPLAARFGEAVGARLNAALGNISEPISPALPVTSPLVRLAFAEPVGRIEDIAAALNRLLGILCRTLERSGEGARRLVLMLYRPDGTTARLAIGTARPNRDPAHLARLFAEHLDTIDFEFGIDEAVLAAIVTDTMGAAQTALVHSSRNGKGDPAALDTLIDRLGNRVGGKNVLRPALRQSHLPERAAGLMPVFGNKENNNALAETAFPSLTPRPSRLLRPPEPIKAEIHATSAAPHQFHWRRVLHHIARIEGPERIAPEWWRTGHHTDRPPHRGTRDYYRAEDRNGQRFWIYREDTESGSDWYLHGLFG